MVPFCALIFCSVLFCALLFCFGTVLCQWCFAGTPAPARIPPAGGLCYFDLCRIALASHVAALFCAAQRILCSLTLLVVGCQGLADVPQAAVGQVRWPLQLGILGVPSPSSAVTASDLRTQECSFWSLLPRPSRCPAGRRGASSLALAAWYLMSWACRHLHMPSLPLT